MGVIPKSWLVKAACCVPMIISRFIWQRIAPLMSISFSTIVREAASQLFPDPKINQQGFLEQGRKVVVPANDLWFWLDEHTGTETIYVLTSEKPMSDIQGLLAKMETVDDAGKNGVAQEIKQRIAIVQRGVGGITKGQAVTYTLSDGKKIQKVTEVVTGTESVVRAVSFLHR